MGSATGERRVAHRVQLAFGVTGEAEWLEQRLLVAHQLPGHQVSDPDHLVAVVRVGDDVGVLPESVEDRKVVRRKRTYPAGRRLAIQATLALESLGAVRQTWGPHDSSVRTP